MAKGRSPRNDAERTKLQIVSHENKQLKQELNRLRKLLDRLEEAPPENCPHCVQEYIAPETQKPLKNQPFDVLKPDRQCFKCHEGTLVIYKYNKIDQTWYYRKCTNCPHRTAGKKWSEEVKE